MSTNSNRNDKLDDTVASIQEMSDNALLEAHKQAILGGDKTRVMQGLLQDELLRRMRRQDP